MPLDARQSHEIIHAIRGEPIGAPVDAEVSGEGYRFKALPMTSPGPGWGRTSSSWWACPRAR
ncbi:hypothetical protein E4A41_12450 [Micrococcus endophyticus]|nr:hypothetical protein E4A41_12450 [Micrococcus endophyticus]